MSAVADNGPWRREYPDRRGIFLNKCRLRWVALFFHPEVRNITKSKLTWLIKAKTMLDRECLDRICCSRLKVLKYCSLKISFFKKIRVSSCPFTVCGIVAFTHNNKCHFTHIWCVSLQVSSGAVDIHYEATVLTGNSNWRPQRIQTWTKCLMVKT